MKEMLKSYEKTINEIENRIMELKIELKREREIEKIHSLEKRIELLSIERADLIRVAAKIKAHLGSKPVHPSLLYRSVSGGF